jgi:outer membrane protein assembly factor BamB
VTCWNAIVEIVFSNRGDLFEKRRRLMDPVIDDVVIVGLSSGNVYAVDPASGSQMWSANAGAPIARPDEQNVSQPLTGFGAGEGYLIVPAGNKLTAWHISGP